MTKTKPRSSFFKKFIISFFLIAIGAGSYVVYDLYNRIYQPNVTLHGKQTEFFYIRTGWILQDVVNALYERNYIINRNAFEWVAERKNYRNNVKPGKYLLKEEMSNAQLIDLLRSGEQSPVNVTFNNIRLKEELAARIGGQLEADSTQLLEMLSDPEIARTYGFTKETFVCMFIPNTYEMYWNTSAEELIGRVAKEYTRFWNGDRKAKARKWDLSQSEVTILAAIVNSETAKSDEQPRVAGVYLNRLKKGMRLQADPTLIFALGDFSIKRVLNKHREIGSPYNTYIHAGLPPGPIRIPSIAAIDAVLNSESHSYLYFCAKDDLSGYHNFAKTYKQHIVNARKYQRALNKRRVYK